MELEALDARRRAASAADHQQGSSSSHQPIGRSMRASWRKGRHDGRREAEREMVETESGSSSNCCRAQFVRPGAGEPD